MKSAALAASVLVIALVLIAGCTQSQSPAAATPAPATTTAGSLPAAAAVTPQPSFALGNHYLQKSYPFQSEKDVFTEQFRVDNPSWGIDLQILPLNDDPQYCWFEMTVTNLDTGRTEKYGYGRTYSYEKHQQVPMYVTGPYQIDMKGNRVKVDVTAAKRNP